MRHDHLPFNRRITLRLAFSAGALVAGAGCAPQWYYSYAEAEQARQRDLQKGRAPRDILVFYKDHLDPKSGQMEDVLETPLLKPLINGKTRCMLISDFARHQRYMAQYGVDSAPALVVVHPDGTFHAQQGLLTSEQCRDFLTGAVGTGASPRTDLQILPVPDYNWDGSYEKQAALAGRQNRPLLIVYKWWLSTESTELLRRLSQPRVRRHFSEMVHCLLDWDYIPNRTHVAQYGVTKVPAMIVVRPDGTYHVLVGLATVEQIIRFAVNARFRGRPTPARGRSGTAASMQ